MVFERSTAGTWHHASPRHLHRHANEAVFRLGLDERGVDTGDYKIALPQGIAKYRCDIEVSLRE